MTSPQPPEQVVPPPCGFLVLDKPAGLTSHACVARVRRAWGLRRVGHGGTLDPSVTGVLPIALGPATRLLPYLSGDKVYRGVVQLGLCTASDDLDGEILERRSVPSLEREALKQVLDRFRGEIRQRPPLVSAVHVQGERAHARVRRGETFTLEPRTVRIRRLDLIGWNPQQGQLEIEVACSAGTYIRSLARDLGEALGCGGTLAGLRRTSALGFGLGQALPLERLEERPLPPLIEPLAALPHLPRQRLTAAQLTDWRCGRSLPLSGAAMAEQPVAEQPVAVLTPDGRLAGIARADGRGSLRPRLVFEAAG